MGSRWVALGLVVCLWGQLAYAATAHGQARPAPSADAQAQARQAFERGRIHYENGEFDKASGAFEEAYRLSGREGLLYNLYLAYRDANQQEKAAEALRSYLAKVEVIENRAQLEARLKALDEGIAQRKAEEEAERQAEAERQRREQERAQQQAQQVRTERAAPTAPQNGKWWIAPVAVMSAGGALMLGSLVTGLMANGKAQDLEDSCVDGSCPARLKGTADSGKTLSLVTDVLLFGGLATVATGGVLLLLKKPKSERQTAARRTPRADLACTRVGCAGSLTVAF